MSRQSITDHAADLIEEVKPRLRGWLHAGTFPVALVAGLVLIAMAGSIRARMACAVYVGTLALLFGISALYHRGNWTPRVNAVFRRLDHANIFLFIAGSYTPIALLLLDQDTAHLLLAVVWVGALLGAAFQTFWIGAPRWLYVPLYIALGWTAVFFAPEFMRSGGWLVVGLIAAGGILYSLGALVYGIKRPNPSPRWFGFHEVFHSLTIVAFVSQYIAISIVAYTRA
ncbi:MAG: hemolysin III family protein [Longispora sp.]|nr:hemolysin III family protein [Longispora sp. (in: high G+C Gram-positive bacteria)]